MIRCCGEGINVFKGDEKNNGLQKFCKAALEPVVISNYKSALCHEYGSGKILAFGINDKLKMHESDHIKMYKKRL